MISAPTVRHRSASDSKVRSCQLPNQMISVFVAFSCNRCEEHQLLPFAIQSFNCRRTSSASPTSACKPACHQHTTASWRNDVEKHLPRLQCTQWIQPVPERNPADVPCSQYRSHPTECHRRRRHTCDRTDMSCVNDAVQSLEYLWHEITVAGVEQHAEVKKDLYSYLPCIYDPDDVACNKLTEQQSLSSDANGTLTAELQTDYCPWHSLVVSVLQPHIIMLITQNVRLAKLNV